MQHSQFYGFNTGRNMRLVKLPISLHIVGENPTPGIRSVTFSYSGSVAIPEHELSPTETVEESLYHELRPMEEFPKSKLREDDFIINKEKTYFLNEDPIHSSESTRPLIGLKGEIPLGDSFTTQPEFSAFMNQHFPPRNSTLTITGKDGHVLTIETHYAEPMSGIFRAEGRLIAIDQENSPEFYTTGFPNWVNQPQERELKKAGLLQDTVDKALIDLDINGAFVLEREKVISDSKGRTNTREKQDIENLEAYVQPVIDIDPK
jgi:hypothetical protein